MICTFRPVASFPAGGGSKFRPTNAWTRAAVQRQFAISARAKRASEMSEMRSGIGDRPKRREDLRFLTGRGAYLDDLAFDGLTYAVVLRSPHAHARIGGIDTAAHSAAPGVLAVLTAADAQADGLQPLLPTATANSPDRRAVRLCPAAGSGRGQGPLCRRAGRSDRRRDPRTSARCRRTGRGRLYAASGGDHRRSRPCRRRAADRRRGAGQSLLRLANRRQGGGR